MSKHDKFSTNNLLKEKIFVGTETTTISKEEANFIQEVLSESAVEECGFEVSEIVKSLQLIDQNTECDSYSFTFDNKLFVLKINEDDPDNVLEREYNNLKLLKGKPISPIPSFFGRVNYSDSQVNILIVTLEASFSLFDISERQFFELLEPLAINLSFLHEFTQEARDNEADLFLQAFLDDNDFEAIVPDDILENFKTKIPNYSKCVEFLHLIKSEVTSEIKELEQSDFSLCHTNLTKSKILLKNNFFKFINFQQSFVLDPFFDLAFLCLSTGLCKSPSAEKTLLEKYFKHHRLLDLNIKDAEEKLKKFKNTCSKIALARLSSEMVFELSTHQNKRPNRMLKMIKRYEYIRPQIQEAFPNHIELTDDFFYLFT